MKKRIALEGGINGLTDDACINWRDHVMDELGGIFDFHNPMDFDCRGREREMEQDLVNFDEAGIASSDILLVNASTGGWGTAMAVQMGFDQGKEIITIYTPKNPISPWLHNRSSVVFGSLAAALDYLAKAEKGAAKLN